MITATFEGSNLKTVKFEAAQFIAARNINFETMKTVVDDQTYKVVITYRSEQ